MKKLEATRSRSKAARLAKAKTARLLLDSQKIKPTEEIIHSETPRIGLWAKINRIWRRLTIWQKILAPLIPVALGIYSALPHFSISRETTNAIAPYAGEFLFKNEGLIPATYVAVQCTISTKMAGSGISISMKDNTITNYVADVVWGRSDFTRGCHITDSKLYPVDKGNLRISVMYSYPFIRRWITTYPTSFSFRYDSQSGGYVFVPEVSP
jgi:hypothetical protein